MEVIGRQLEGEAAVESRYRLAHPHNFGPYNFESAQVGIYISNLDGEILHCNEAFAQLLGCASPQELIGQQAETCYLSPNDREEFIARLRIQGRLINFEVRLRRKDGSPVWGLENASLRPAE